ncbi:MAG: hypothetical protein ABIM88_06510, partial [candidate division WOR-3 bacterium]
RVWWRVVLVLAYCLPLLIYYRKKLFWFKKAFYLQRDLEDATPIPFPPELVIKRIENVKDLEGLWPGKEKEFKKRLEREIECYMGLWNGKPAHLSWVSTIGEREGYTGSRSNPGNAYIFDSVTFKEFRGLGIYSWMINEICLIMKRRGIRFAEAIVFTDARIPLKNLANLGFKRTHLIMGIRLFGITFTWRRKLEEGEG